MELGALMVAASGDANLGPQGLGLWTPSLPVFGKTVLGTWVERLESLGVNLLSIVNHDQRKSNGMETVVEWAHEGVERILLIILGSYAEIDFADLIRFHQARQNHATRVFDPEGPLGISLLDRRCVLRNPKHAVAARYSRSSRYDFHGYVNRLSSTVSYRKLVEDALQGRCGIQPTGRQADQNVWIHETAHLDPSVQIQGPCYIGAETRIKAGVTLRGCSTVEQNCEIDVGTTLDQATILPNTYLAPGLHVRASVVNGTKLEHLTHGVTVDLAAAGLAARMGASENGSSPASDLAAPPFADSPSELARMAQPLQQTDLGETHDD